MARSLYSLRVAAAAGDDLTNAEQARLARENRRDKFWIEEFDERLHADTQRLASIIEYMLGNEMVGAARSADYYRQLLFLAWLHLRLYESPFLELAGQRQRPQISGRRGALKRAEARRRKARSEAEEFEHFRARKPPDSKRADARSFLSEDDPVDWARLDDGERRKMVEAFLKRISRAQR